MRVLDGCRTRVHAHLYVLRGCVRDDDAFWLMETNGPIDRA